MHVGSTSHVFQILKSVCKSLFLNDSVLCHFQHSWENVNNGSHNFTNFHPRSHYMKHIVRRLVKEWMKRINGFLEMYTAKPTECERVKIAIIQSSWQAETGPPTGATLSPTEQVIVTHFSSGPLNTLLAFWIASAKKKKSRVSFGQTEKMCVGMRLICLRRFSLTSPHIPVPSHREKFLNVPAVFVWDFTLWPVLFPWNAAMESALTFPPFIVLHLVSYIACACQVFIEYILLATLVLGSREQHLSSSVKIT